MTLFMRLRRKFFQADGNASFLRAARSGNLEKVIEFLKGNVDINTSNANGLNALHLAAKEGHVNVVTELVKRGANVNAATKKGNTALHIASLAGQEEVVKVLVQLGANVNVQSQNGFTPLYMAAQENHDAVVSFLLANGANQSLATEDGFTPLAVALQQGHDKVVAVLLENDTKGKVRLPALHIAAKKDDCKAATLLLQSDHNPDVTSKSGFTPLHIAAHYGNENIAKILLSKGADVNYAAKHQITPLHVASKWGKMNMVTLLLEKGANIDASTRDGLTPLHCAARSGHDTVVDVLLEKGAPFLAKTKNGLAPLHMASQGDHIDSARILLYHKAPVDDVTVDYLTALHVAAHCGHVKVAKLLLDRKADPNARALNGFTPLHIACKKNRIKVVELLLKHGASIEATTESGLTPLHVASFMGCMNIVIYLIQNGSNPDVPTVRGETPLHLAARANQTDIIRILLRNGASVDARAREEQTPLHIAARLGNVDIVSLLLQHGAAVDAVTKDMYTPLHITAKEDQEEVAAALLDHGASLTATTKKGFTPLHLAAKYGNIKVARLLLQKGAPVDAQGKNGVTPLHVAAHYDHVNVALLLLDKGASPHAMAKNGYTPLHIAAKKNQMDIASTLLEYGANTNSESKAGFTPLHLSAQEGHADLSTLLIENKADVNHKANNGLTPLHLCAQDDRVNVAQVLVQNGAEICPQTKAGYTPLHVASHFGQINMVRFLLQNDANVHTVTSHGYTPLHQAAQQGHTLVVNLLLENQASPNVTTVQGQTPLSIAQRLGYISVVETLKVVTETTVTTTTTTVTEEKYKVVAPETMQETFMTDSEDEGGEEAMLGDQSYRYLTADEMKSLGDDSLPIDVTKDEKQQDAVQAVKQFVAPMVEEDNISPQHGTPVESGFSEKFSPDNIDLVKAPVHAGLFSVDDAYYYIPPKGMLRSSSRLKWKTFLVSFMVDARGGAMRGCRHSGVRVIIPPRKASMPMRITCRYLRKEKLIHPPPLMEGEACASRILEMGPVGARFLGPVIIEVPHFASTRGKEREITILRSDTGESWREHTLEASEEAVQEVLNESFEGEELSALEDLNTNRITRILTTDFPQYFAIVTRIRQEVHGVGPEGGMVSSTVVPQVQAIFPEGALTKKIRVGLQAQPIAPELVTKLLGNRVAVSPIVTVEPRRRKFHKPITLTIPVPQAATKGMINQYSGDAPTLRLLCSITGGSSKAQWEDVTGSTPLTFVNDCVSFTTTVSARFWLMDCRQVNEVTRFATELYQEAVYVPFMSKFVIFAKRHDPFEAQLRVFCMTDDKEDKTLESQEHFTEVAKSRDVEVLEGKLQYLEFAGNLVPVTKSGEQLKFTFQAFHENRLPFIIRVKDPHAEPMGRIAFMKEPKAGRGEPPQTPICNLNVALPDITMPDNADVLELVTLEKRYDFIQEAGLSKPELIHRADLRLSDIARELDKDWVLLAQQLDIPEQDVEQIQAQTVCDQSEQARMMLRMWLQKSGSKATGNELEKGLRRINREDIIKNCMFNVELVTDDVEKAVAKVHLDQSGFDVFKEELGSSREASMRRATSLDDEQDIMKEAESAAETSSETGSLFDRDQLSQALTDDRDAKIRRPSKTPPPSPIDETVYKGGIEIEKLKEISSLLPEVKEFEVQKPQETEFRKVEVVVLSSVQQEIPSKLTESETWQSGDLDTSQVSVSSLPEDDKSEPRTTAVSSTAVQEITKNVVPDTEIMDVDKSGTTTHIIQKTTHMTLISNTKSDNGSVEGELQGIIPVESKMEDEAISLQSPELSFAEKRDFFQKLSLSSSSPSVTPTHTSKTNVETEIKLLPVTDNVINLEVSPDEQLSFVERLKFFESSAEKHPVQTIMPEVKEIKKEVWTVSENELNEPKSSVYSDEIFEKEREIETIEVLEETSCIPAVDDVEGVSSPLYADKEVLETTFDTNKDAKVEVMVKKFSPGSEMFEICSVENISKTESGQTIRVTVDVTKVTTQHSEEKLLDKKVSDESITEESVIKQEVSEKIITDAKPPAADIPKSESLSDFDHPETDEEYITKTFKAVTESSYEASRSTVGAFKKGVNEKLENKWQRESPDNISIVKETMEPSLGKSEIFICTEETLDNVKKILSVADAESNIVVPENGTTSVETLQEAGDRSFDDSKSGITVDVTKDDRKLEDKQPRESLDDISVAKEKAEPLSGKGDVFICTEDTLDSVKKILSIADAESNIFVPESGIASVETLQERIDDDTKPSLAMGITEENVKEIEAVEMLDSGKIDFTQECEEEVKIIEEQVEKISQKLVESSRKTEQDVKVSYDIEIDKESIKDVETKEFDEKTEAEKKFEIDDKISKEISDGIEIIEEISVKTEKDSKIAEPLQITDRNTSRPDNITVKSSVTHTTVIEKTDVISEHIKDKSLEFGVKIMNKETLSSEKVSSDKIEPIHSKDEIQQGKISPSSIGEKSDSSSAKEKSIEIEFVPVLEVSNDVKVSMEKTGHEALGTPCSFHKEMSIESQHSELEQSFEKRQLDTEKKIPLTTFGAVEKAEHEEVEKGKKENIESIIYKESISHKTSGKETVQSVEVTQFTKHSTEVYNVPSEKLKEKFTSKKIHIDTSAENKESKGFVPQKLNQFLDSVTQSHDVGLPSDVAPVHKRTEEWLDQSGDLMLKEGAVIDNVDNGFFEDRPPTLDDEHQRRSSPTAESFDDKARVEQCDTDVMMQLLDFVSRNEIELAEVRTEDEAPDIEEDVSPSGEEEICSRAAYEEGKANDKTLLPESLDEKNDDYLKVSKNDNLQLSPLRSSFDSVTSPSKKDYSSDNIETVMETKYALEKELKHERVHPQSSLEVEVGSHGSDEMGHLEVERETATPLSFVEEEESAKMELKHSSKEEKLSKFEDSKQYTKEAATTSNVIDSSDKLSTDLNEKEDKSKPCEEIKVVSSKLETVVKSSDVPDDSGSIAIVQADKEKDAGEHVEPLHPETDTVDSEELCKITKDLYLSEKDSDLTTETQYVEKTDSSFVSCAFINTAFAGTAAIDEVEQVSPVRARSPYEVIRGKEDQISDIPLEEEETNLSTIERVTYVTRHVEIRHRPLLRHIPSEISEEDLVEREITSPVTRDELESSDQSVESESKMLKISDAGGDVKTVKDHEFSDVAIVKTTTMPLEIDGKTIKDETSEVTIVTTVTKIKHDQSSDYQEISVVKDQNGDFKRKSDISEFVLETKDVTMPESDTEIPTSPFEIIDENELSDDGEHKAGTSSLPDSFVKSEEDDKSKDSAITTAHSQSVAEKAVIVASSVDQDDNFNEKSKSDKTEDVSHIVDHSTMDVISDDKPLTNGPGEVEYHPDYDYDGESVSKKNGNVFSDRSAYNVQETDVEHKFHYSSVSDDGIDSEIREILSSDQQLEDIIERPVTPEPPKDDVTDAVGFVTSHFKRPSVGEIEGLMREGEFAYSDDAPLSSPTSPDSKSGFAYGMQFEKYVIEEGEEAMDIDSDQFSEEKEPPYAYNMRFERDPDLEEDDVPCYGDLYTHEEEDEDALENGEKAKIMQKPVKESEFDMLAGRKYFSKNVEVDELSMSSLQEFERLEAEIVSGRKSSVGSLDSLNGKQPGSRSGDHDDVSMSSLTEFERIERECTEGDKIDPSMQESITQLSEIEEGHESQASEASQENKSDVGKEEDISIADDYNNQLENIEEIILEVENKKLDELPFQIMMKQQQKSELTGHDTEITNKEKQIDNKILNISKEKVTRTSTGTEVIKITGWTTSKSLESSSLGDARDDLDQDSLRDELSLKPDSLIDDSKIDFQDSLHEERFDDADSLQENLDEMRDSLFEERHIEDDSLHEMDIMPDESSLSLEGSLPAIASLDSSKADEPIKSKITNFKNTKDIQPEVILGSATETFQVRQAQINITDLSRGGDVMQSSTDSLEQSSSALAAFQIESESLMSSSLNSAITSEDNTMVSSSDTIEPEGRITYRYEDIPVDDIEMLVRSGHRVIVDSEGNIQAHFEGRQCIETEEIRNAALGFHKDVTEIKLPPTTTVQVHSALTAVEYVNGRQEQEKHFRHSSGDEDYESYESSHFDPDVEVEEIQTTDEFGNTKIIRKIKKVTHTKTQYSSSSSPKDVEEKLKEFLREHTAGDKAGTAEEEVEEQKTTDDKGNVVVIRTVKRHIHTEPEIHSKTFTGPTADQQSQKFVETFQTLDPTEDVSEYEKVDEQGNVVRVTEKFVVTPKLHTVSFSGPDAHKQMEDYMKQWTLQSQNIGEFEGDQQRTMLPSLQSSRTFEQSETSAPSDSSSNLVQTVIGDTIVTKTLSSTFSADSSEKIEIPESSTSTTISFETTE